MDSLNPGIRLTVAWLNENGFITTDSGDGATHDHPCDRDYPYIVIVSRPSLLKTECDRLVIELKARGVAVGEMSDDGRSPYVQATYAPGSSVPAVIELVGVTDAVLFS